LRWFFCPDASKAQNNLAAVFLLLRRTHEVARSRQEKCALISELRIRVAILQQRSRLRCSEPCWNLRKRYSKPLLASKIWTTGANSYGRPHRTATDQQRFRSLAPWWEFHCGAFIARGTLRGRWRGARRGFAF